MPKVTIDDISRATGLSRGTVSRALNDRPDISLGTKQRVLEACRRLKYVPSRVARSLATGRNYAVAVVVDDLASVFAAAFARGVIAQAARQRYVVHLVELPARPAPPQERLDALSCERIDGALIAARLDAGGAQAVCESVGPRILASTWPLPGISCDVLMPDQEESGRLVARHLLRRGVGDVLYVQAAGRPGADERLEGFRQVASQHQLDPDALIVRVAAEPATDLGELAAAERRLVRARAVAASDDALAVTLMLLLGRAGRVPGRDVAVLGQGNEALGGRIRPRLSTVDFNGEEIGRRAMQTVLQRLSGSRMDAPQTTKVAPRLMLRDSA